MSPTIRLPNSTLPDQIVIPEGADIHVVDEGAEEIDDGEDEVVSFGNRTVLVVRVLGTVESPEESVTRLEGAVFGLGNEPLTNSMRAQFRRCSFSKIDFVPPSGYTQFDNGVVNIQLGYRLRGKNVFRVLNDAITSVADLLGLDSLRRNFHHVVFCMGRGTTHPVFGTEWLPFAVRNKVVLNSNRCDSLSYLMHEIGHNLGLVHSGDDITGSGYGDTTGMVSSAFSGKAFVHHP